MSDILVKNLNIALGFVPNRRNILDDVSFSVDAGECFGLVGESGSGKSTVLRCIAKLLTTWTGSILVGGESVQETPARRYCRLVQMVFQDPYGSLHPRQSVQTTLMEPLRIHKLDKPSARIEKALNDVGLSSAFLPRFPHELSGGQRQRVAIARALILEPPVLLLDEPTSALDVSVQAEVLNLLTEVRARRKLSYIIVSHDLAVIDYMCDRFAVMRGGRIVEVMDRAALSSDGAQHEYSRSLIRASLEYERAV